MVKKEGDIQNLIVLEDESEFEDFDDDNTMETMLKMFVVRRIKKKEKKNNEESENNDSDDESSNNGSKNDEYKPSKMDKFSFITFIIFLCVNVFCASYNLTKAINEPTKESNMFSGVKLNARFFNATYINTDSTTDTIISQLKNTNNTGITLDVPTKALYFTEFTIIMIFAIIAIYYHIRLYFNPDSLNYLSGAANFTRLVREFSCFSLVPLFNVNTLTNIYSDISNTFEEEKKKYADRSELWDGIWGVGTKDVQKTNSMLELGNETDKIELNTEEYQGPTKVQEESRFKKFKQSKFFLFIVSIAIYTGFLFSFLIVLLLAVFAFIALYIKARHVGNFISTDNSNFTYKWFNFITFIMNIASLNQQSPAIKLIIYQLKVLTRKAHINEYNRRKQNRIKENMEKFKAEDDEEIAPKIIIHRKKIHRRSADDNDIKGFNEDEFQEIDADKLSPNSIKRKTSKLSTKSTNSY